MYYQKYGEICLYISKGFQSKLLGTNIALICHIVHNIAHKSSKAHTNSNHVNHEAAHIAKSKKEGPFSVVISTIQ